jgi:tetratricopeptide (TPR) repeat protein
MLSFAGEIMSNVASSYRALGRHQDALKMQEKTLEFRRRVLPENHPQIGAMRMHLILCLVIRRSLHQVKRWAICYNLANSYSDLGRHQDALVMHEKTLEFRRRVLPENHPQIGAMRMWLFDWGESSRCFCR